MIPKEPLVTVKTGLPKLGWFRTSNISVRNCKLNRSLILVSLVTEKSVLTKFGPVIELRPKSPGWQVGSVAGGTAGAQGDTNSVLLENH